MQMYRVSIKINQSSHHILDIEPHIYELRQIVSFIGFHRTIHLVILLIKRQPHYSKKEKKKSTNSFTCFSFYFENIFFSLSFSSSFLSHTNTPVHTFILLISQKLTENFFTNDAKTKLYSLVLPCPIGLV